MNPSADESTVLNNKAQAAMAHCGPLMAPAPIHSIAVEGELRERIARNYDRLEEEYYQSPHVFTSEMHKEWPGDLEGRIILALVMAAQGAEREPKHLASILEELPGHFNEKGYLGVIRPEGLFDDQQFAGHGWVLRGLCEYYAWRRDPAILQMAETIVDNLFLPSTECYVTYPGSPEERVGEDDHCPGKLTGSVHGNWCTSGDTGAAFIALDGLAHVFEIHQTPQLERLLRNMIEKFVTIDFVGIHMQVHATLTALRGMMRFYELAKDPAILEQVERIFGLYLERGYTENYANYLWFQRPESTEPCAIVDSFVLAFELWRHTGALRYLDDAHHILYNALGYAQRPNGMWGCDECAGTQDPFLRPSAYPHPYEVPWCCTMRGVVGLVRAATYSYLQDADQVVMPFYGDHVAQLSFPDGEVRWRQTTRYPLEGLVQITVLDSSVASPKRLCVYLPSWAEPEKAAVTVNGNPVELAVQNGLLSFTTPLAKGDAIEYRFAIALRKHPTLNPLDLKNCYTLRHGALILGVKSAGDITPIATLDDVRPLGQGKYGVGDTGSVLEPINDFFYLTDEQAKQDKRQILFEEMRVE